MNTNTPDSSQIQSVSGNSLWKTEFNKRVKAFAAAIGADEVEVRNRLADLGADGEKELSLTLIDTEEYLPFGDLRNAFIDKEPITKLAILRAAIPHLRGKSSLNVNPTSTCDELTGAIKNMVASNRPKSNWTDGELLASLDDTATEAAEILSKRTRGRHCIIFKSDGTVDVESSLKLVRIAKRQSTSNQHPIGGQLVEVYRAGVFPARLLDESPFSINGVSHLVDGFCSKSNTDWTGISYEARILVRIYTWKCETTQLSKREMKQIRNDAAEGAESFRSKYPEAAMWYNKLAAADELPRLKSTVAQGECCDGDCSCDSGF